MFMKRAECVTSLLTLANSAELVNNIARNVLGNDVADTFQGSVISRGLIYNMVQTQAQQKLADQLQGA
jgi:hypothetical protein